MQTMCRSNAWHRGLEGLKDNRVCCESAADRDKVKMKFVKIEKEKNNTMFVQRSVPKRFNVGVKDIKYNVCILAQDLPLSILKVVQ